jgi:Fe-S oxidoreductase
MGMFSLFKKDNTLYFPGCVTYFRFPENFELYKKIFNKLRIGFELTDKKVCCGLPALEAGYDQIARKLARRNFEIFKEKEIKSIITNCPGCYKMFLKDYPEMLPDWNIQIKNLWEIIFEKLEKKPGLIKNRPMEVVTYHDPCYLGRYCDIYEEPRKILELIGYSVKELPNSKINSICCGSCGGLARTNPELANSVAKQRILQAKRIGVKKMVVSSIENYELLKNNVGDSGIEILELSEVLALALNIKKKELEFSEEKISDEEQIVLDVESNETLKEELKNEDEIEIQDWEK